MPKILSLETGTDVCSVALSQGNELIAICESGGEIAHAANLSVFIDKVLKETDTRVADLDAVAVSEGPGSYTGTRIGASTAKGLCFGANKPLIAVGSLQSLVMLALDEIENIQANTLLCPMIDARRMEVYTALFDTNGKNISETSAQIVDENTFAELLKSHNIIFFGNGADKCKQVIQSENAVFIDIKASARGLVNVAAQKFNNSDFVDTAYFEPFYLKDFVVTTSKKKIF